MARCCRLPILSLSSALVILTALLWAYVERHCGGWEGVQEWLRSFDAPEYHLLAEPQALSAVLCKAAAAPSVEALRSDRPAGWDAAMLAHKRRNVDVLPSSGEEEAVPGFEPSRCVVGARSRALPAEFAWNRSSCVAHCLEHRDCLGVLWGRVDTQDGVRFQCFLSGVGDDDHIIKYPCQSTWFNGCKPNVTYDALATLAPQLQCWQRLLKPCLSLEDLSAVQAANILALANATEQMKGQLGEEAAAAMVRVRERASLAAEELAHLNQQFMRSPSRRRILRIGSLLCLFIAVLLICRWLRAGCAERRIRKDAAAAYQTAVHIPSPAETHAMLASSRVPMSVQLGTQDAELFGNLWTKAPPSIPRATLTSSAPSPPVAGIRAPSSPWLCPAPASPLPLQPAPCSPAVAPQPASPLIAAIPVAPQPASPFDVPSNIGVAAPASPWSVQPIPSSIPAVVSPATVHPAMASESILHKSSQLAAPGTPQFTRGTPTPTRGNPSPPNLSPLHSFVQAASSSSVAAAAEPDRMANATRAVAASAQQPSAQDLTLVALLSYGDVKTLKALNGFGPKTAATFVSKRPAAGFSSLQEVVTQGLVSHKVMEKLRSNA